MTLEYTAAEHRDTVLKLKRILIDATESKYGIDEISEEAGAFQLGLDSISVLDFILGIEESFGISLKRHEVDMDMGLGQLAMFVDRLRGCPPC